MVRTPKFWKALDELPKAATSLFNWGMLLGDELEYVQRFLRPTGELATVVSCPSPGGCNCPRKIVREVDGSIRALCRDRPKTCDDLDLSREAITVMELDRGRLARALGEALGLSRISPKNERSPVLKLGSYRASTGVNVSFLLAIPGVTRELGVDIGTALGLTVVLTPTASHLASELERSIRDRVSRLALDELFSFDDRKRLRSIYPTDVLLAKVAPTSHDAEVTGGWKFPPHARWEELTIRFVADEVIHVVFDGQTHRIEPDDIGMKNSKNGRPNLQWELLKLLAQNGGRWPVRPEFPKEIGKHQARKQMLSKALRQAFRISGEPIRSEGREYVARFACSADDLEQGKQGRSGRNFAGPESQRAKKSSATKVLK